MRPIVRSTHALTALGAAAALVVTACSGGTSNSASSGSSAAGVTGSSIAVGTVADLSGVIPGLFQGAVNGTKAYAEYINSTGGVNGKKIVVSSVDTGTNCNGAKQAAQQLNGKVFAFVGSFSVYDGCAAAVWQQSGSPVFMFPLTEQVKQLTNLYSPSPAPPGFYTGPTRYFSSQHPGALQHLAILYADASQQTYHQVRAMYDAEGAKVLYSRGVAPTETNYTADIVTMRKKGVQWLDMTSNDLGTVLRVVGAAAQQHWRPQVWIAPTAYDPRSVQQNALSALESEGVQMAQSFAMFQGEDAGRIPEVALFDKWYKQQSHGTAPDLFAMYGWTSMALFVQSLKSVTGTLNQASLLEAVKAQHQFTDNGMLPAADVGAKKPPTCWVLVVAKNGKFVRQSPPSPTDGSFICNNAPYYYLKQ